MQVVLHLYTLVQDVAYTRKYVYINILLTNLTEVTYVVQGLGFRV